MIHRHHHHKYRVNKLDRLGNVEPPETGRDRVAVGGVGGGKAPGAAVLGHGVKGQGPAHVAGEAHHVGVVDHANPVEVKRLAVGHQRLADRNHHQVSQDQAQALRPNEEEEEEEEVRWEGQAEK